MAGVELLPDCEPTFRQRGWRSVTSFLAWTGVLVNRHRDRQVERVTLDGANFFLKKAYAVSWRERFRNAWHGFGWCATVVREAKLLRALRAAGIGCPDVVACGEEGRQAFVLLREAAGMTELRLFLQQLSSPQERHRLALALGRELARLHDAGFDHPDLFANHILIAPQAAPFRFCLLDWQRASHRGRLSWRLRCRDWAALDATLHDALAGAGLRLRCLRAYLRALTTQQGHPPLARLARRIRSEAKLLRQKRNVREIAQLPVPAAQQQFVSLHEGRLLIVRAYHEQLGGLFGAGSVSDGHSVAYASGSEKVRASSSPLWELPPLAHFLFRLHRFGVPAPRLLSVARLPAQVVLHLTAAATVPLEQALQHASLRTRRRWLRQAGQIVRQIHEAGYCLAPQQAWERRLGVDRANEQVMLADPEPLQTSTASWQTLARVELSAQGFLRSSTDQLRFLRGYFQATFGMDRLRLWIKSCLSLDMRRWERQKVS